MGQTGERIVERAQQDADITPEALASFFIGSVQTTLYNVSRTYTHLSVPEGVTHTSMYNMYNDSLFVRIHCCYEVPNKRYK